MESGASPHFRSRLRLGRSIRQPLERLRLLRLAHVRWLRKIRPDIKFVFVSGYAEDAFAKNLPADAKFGFLPKPFSLKQLATVVKEVLEAE